MTEFTFQTVDLAPEASREPLEAAQKKLGFLPNLLAGLANAPAALKAYLSLADFISQTSLSPQEQQLVLLATSVENGCDYCVAAHSMLAKEMADVAEPVVAALRDGGQPQDPKLAALAAFTRAVVTERGWVREHPAYRDFLNAGYRPEQALEVILGVAMKTLSNYSNHLLETPLDAVFEGERWSR